MFNISLQTLIFYEIIFILVVICAILLLISIKQKKLIRELQEQFKAMRKRMHQILSELDRFSNDAQSDLKRGDSVDTFLHSIAQYSLERFKKFTPDGIPSLAPNAAFGAKVAALRYFYVMAEVENRSKKNSPENWLLLEKNLSGIVRWVRNIPKNQSQSGGRIKQLHEKIDQLKRHATENSHLKRHLTLARQKSQTLEDENKNHKENIKKMQTMLSAFQRAFPATGSATIANEIESVDASEQTRRHERAYSAYQSSIFQVNNISQISQQKQDLLNQLSEKFNNSFAGADESHKATFSQKIKILEKDIQGSESHISSLQHELKTARDHIAQLKEKPIQTQDIADQIMAGTLVIESSNDTIQAIAKLPTWIEEGGHGRTLDEIEHLRNNNQHQRQMILELNSEINQLREHMNNTQDEKIKAEKGKEIMKLERLVKECEYCIETLESEVDLLRDQIAGEYENEIMHPDIQKLNKDIEQMSAQLHQTINQCTHANIINQISISLLECNDMESIAQLIVDTLKKLNVNFGFYLESIIAKIEYHADGKSTPQEQKALKLIENASIVGYINEGILFFRTHARIIIKNPPDEDETQAILETTLNTLTQLINAKINHLESLTKVSNHDDSIKQSIVQVKAQLIDIKKRHEAQFMDSQNIIHDLAKEIKASVELLNPSPSVMSVFENAINESYKRMDRVATKSDIIQKNSNEIINALEKSH